MHFHILPKGTIEYHLDGLQGIATKPDEFRIALLAFHWGWAQAHWETGKNLYGKHPTHFYWKQLTIQRCVYNADFTKREFSK